MSAVSTALKNAIYGDKRPVIIGRNGSIELASLFFPGRVPVDVVERHTGVWPDDTTSISAWRESYLQANHECDCIAAGWYSPLAELEFKLVSRLCPDARLINLRDLEPYYNPDKESRWTCLLKNQRVAVVSSFADTMKSQMERRSLIWPNDYQSLLPDDTEFHFVRTGYSPKMSQQSDSSWGHGIVDWKSAINWVVDEVLKTKSTVALVGCGGLGMIIACELKKRGVSTVVMGGAIQVLFGIKGKRWENHPVISGFWNDAGWVYPSDDEIPPLSSTVEQGCYWK